jgi:outer membrane protein TolC
MQLAEQRVRKALASEEINGVQRGIKISANAVDVLTTYKTTAAASSVSVQQPGLSGFGIPTVTDQSSGTLYSSTSTSGLTSGVTSGGAGSSTTLSSTLTIIPVTGAPGSTSTSGSSSTGTGAITGTGTGNAPVNGRSVSAPVDALIQKLASATGSGVASSRANAQAVAAGTGSAQYNNYAAGISASKVIDVYGLIGISQDVLKSATTFYRIDRDRTANELALTVKNTYFAALRAQANVLTAQEQVNSAQATVNDATIRFNAGAVAEYDVISAKTTLSNANQSLISARNNVTVQKQTLNNLLGQPLDTEFTLVEPALPTLPANFDPKAAVQAAYGKRPEIQQVNLDITIAQRLTKLASAGMKPTFGVGANVNYTGANPGSDGNYINGALVAQVSIPLDDAGLTRANVRSAREDERTQAIVKDQLTQNIALEVRSALANVVDAQALVAADVEGVRLSRESLRLANVRYQAGAGTLLEVTNAEANLATAEYNLASAQFQLQTAYAAYLRASGLR